MYSSVFSYASSSVGFSANAKEISVQTSGLRQSDMANLSSPLPPTGHILKTHFTLSV